MGCKKLLIAAICRLVEYEMLQISAHVLYECSKKECRGARQSDNTGLSCFELNQVKCGSVRVGRAKTSRNYVDVRVKTGRPVLSISAISF